MAHRRARRDMSLGEDLKEAIKKMQRKDDDSCWIIWIINLGAKYNEGVLLWNDFIPRIAKEQKKLEWSSSSAEWKKKMKEIS